MLTLPDGRVMAVSQASEERSAILAAEAARLDTIKAQIDNYIRQADGSPECKAQIDQMTQAMISARRGLDKGMEMPIAEFFDTYSKIIADSSDTVGEPHNR